MPLLALETSSDACSVAVWHEDGLVVEEVLHRPRMHAAHLVPLIRDALRYASVQIRALEAIAVSAGPGSYTGLRIGASTAKGLAIAAEAPLVAVPTLEALAQTVVPYAAAGDLVGSVLESRRGEVYVAAYRLDDASPDQPLTALFEAAALPVEEAAHCLAAQPEANLRWLAGPGATRLADVLDAAPPTRLLARARPLAGAVARLGARRLRQGCTEDVTSFEPLYLKPFKATKRRQSLFDQLPS